MTKVEAKQKCVKQFGSNAILAPPKNNIIMVTDTYFSGFQSPRFSQNLIFYVSSSGCGNFYLRVILWIYYPRDREFFCGLGYPDKKPTLRKKWIIKLKQTHESLPTTRELRYYFKSFWVILPVLILRIIFIGSSNRGTH